MKNRSGFQVSSVRVALHIAFWLTLLAINIAVASRFDDFHIEMLVEIVNVAVYAAVFYLNVLVLFPKYYPSDRIAYIVISLALLILFSILLSQADRLFFMLAFDYHHVREWGISTFIHPLWLIMIYLIGTVYSIQHLLNQQIRRNREIAEEKLHTELQLLKNQINPHFLFNALNNVYSLTYTQSEKAPDSILKLSEMLRYVIEDCSKEHVTLVSEVDYILNLIEFYKLKIPGKRNIQFVHEVDHPNISIAPMLFLPFIENSFKFSRIEEDKSGFIDILLKETGGRVIFDITNSIFMERKIMHGSQKGISNVSKRLEIIYPDRHTLVAKGDEKVFRVEMQIDLT